MELEVSREYFVKYKILQPLCCTPETDTKKLKKKIKCKQNRISKEWYILSLIWLSLCESEITDRFQLKAVPHSFSTYYYSILDRAGIIREPNYHSTKEMEEQAARSSQSPSYRDAPRIQVDKLISMSASIDKKQEDFEFKVSSVGSFTTFFMLLYNSRGRFTPTFTFPSSSWAWRNLAKAVLPETEKTPLDPAHRLLITQVPG